MRRRLIIGGLLLCVPAVKAQSVDTLALVRDSSHIVVDTTVSSPVQLKHTGLFSVSGAITNLANWNPGGENSANLSFLVRQNWKRESEHWTTNHLLELNYGLSRQAGLLTKNADKVEWTTSLLGSLDEYDWTLSGQLNARTQIAPGFAPGDTLKVPLSTLGAPLYVQFSLGAAHKEWEGWDVFFSPISSKTTAVLDSTLREKGSFGVPAGEAWRWEGGGKATVLYADALSEHWTLNAKLDLFYNYLQPISNIDVQSEAILIYSLEKYLSLNMHVQLVRDVDVIGAWQRRSVFGVGLTFSQK